MIYREKDIDKARQAFKTGSDLSTLATALKKLGIEHYDYQIQAGKYAYFGANGYVLDYATKPVDFGKLGTPDSAAVEKISKAYLAGQTDFEETIKQLAQAGVGLVTVNLEQQTVDYSDDTGVILGTAKY